MAVARRPARKDLGSSIYGAPLLWIFGAFHASLFSVTIFQQGRQRAGHFDQKQPSQHIVTAVVRIFKILPIPVMRVARVVVRPPEFQAMNAVSQKGVVNIDEIDVLMFVGGLGNDLVIGPKDS